MVLDIKFVSSGAPGIKVVKSVLLGISLKLFATGAACRIGATGEGAAGASGAVGTGGKF